MNYQGNRLLHINSYSSYNRFISSYHEPENFQPPENLLMLLKAFSGNKADQAQELLKDMLQDEFVELDNLIYCKEGLTLLHLACLHHATKEVVKMVIGKRPEALRKQERGRYGRIPLHIACSSQASTREYIKWLRPRSPERISETYNLENQPEYMLLSAEVIALLIDSYPQAVRKRTTIDSCPCTTPAKTEPRRKLSNY